MSIAVVIAALLAAAPALLATSVGDARDAVEANMRTAEGKAYDQRLGSEFQEKYPGTVRQCKKQDNGGLRPFWMLLRLGSDGRVREVLLSPETKIGNCTRETLLRDRFSRPPRDDYWVGIYLELRR